jgi:hypothetical protein
MKAIDFISLAESMLRDANAPSQMRTIISRAYYGAFHLAMELIRELGLATDANHGYLQHDYQNSAHPAASQVGILLQELHGRRVDADYRLQKTSCEDRRLSFVTVVDAQRIAQTISELRAEFGSNPAVQQGFVDAVTAFRRKVGRRV